MKRNIKIEIIVEIEHDDNLDAHSIEMAEIDVRTEVLHALASYVNHETFGEARVTNINLK